MNDQLWLENYLHVSGAVAGTVHRYEERAGDEHGGLRLTAAHNIPPKVCEVVGWVPWGKGMAGQALASGQPVSTCNLKDDPSAAVRPGARAVDAAAAAALPVAAVDGTIQAVVGVAWAQSRELSSDDLQHLTEEAMSVLGIGSVV